MKAFRFELAYQGELRNLGFLQEIDEIGLPIHDEAELINLFDSLACPVIRKPASFWFTTLGLKTYGNAIWRVQKAIIPHGWSLVYAIIDISTGDLKNAIYEDPEQIAFHAKWIKGIMLQYRELRSNPIFCLQENT